MTEKNITFQIQSFTKYLQKPNFEPENTSKISLVFWFLLIFSANFLALTFGLITNFILNKIQYTGQNQVLETISSIPIWLFLILASVQAPLTEEISFRLFLNPSKFKLSLALFGFCFYFLSILNSFDLVFSYSFIPILPILFSNIINSLILSITLYFTFKTNNNFYITIFDYIKTNFFWLFYGSSVIFGLIHLQNFTKLDFFTNYFWLLPILVLPQTIVGVVLAYIRVKNGIVWSIMAHSFYNFITALPIIVLSILPRNVLEMILKLNNSNGSIENKLNDLGIFEKAVLLASSLTSLSILGLGFSCLVYLVFRYKKKATTKVAV